MSAIFLNTTDSDFNSKEKELVEPRNGIPAQYRQVKKKETQLAKAKFTDELQSRVKYRETKLASDMLMITHPDQNSHSLTSATSHSKDNKLHHDNENENENEKCDDDESRENKDHDLSSGFFRNIFRL